MVLAINLSGTFRYSSSPGLSLAKGIRLENVKGPFVFRDIRILGRRRALLCKMARFVRSRIAKPVSGTGARARDFFESRARPVNSWSFHGERAKGKTTGLVKNVVANVASFSSKRAGIRRQEVSINAVAPRTKGVEVVDSISRCFRRRKRRKSVQSTCTYVL